MKLIVSISLFTVITTTIFAQDINILKVGAGIPVFFKKNLALHGYGWNSVSKESLNLIVEKSIIISKDQNLTINPGVSYFHFNEIAESDMSALGGSYDYKVTHNGISINLKLLCDYNFSAARPLDLYFGVVAGKYIFTRSKGNLIWTRLQQQGYVSGITKIDESGRSFFHSFYGGVIIGLKANLNNSFFKPAVEFSLYPSFINLYKRENANMSMISLILEINKQTK